MLTLYNYWRSGPSYRVRIALALKGLAYRYVSVDLRAGAQGDPANAARNPQRLAPTLELADGTFLTQSPAILEYLEEAYPAPALLPQAPEARARVRAMGALIACDIHPLHNLRVFQYLASAFGAEQPAQAAWARRWIEEGLEALEALAGQAPEGPFLWGEAPMLADCHLIPQLFSARRFGAELARFPRLLAIEAAALAHPAFAAAHPARQPDAEPA